MRGQRRKKEKKTLNWIEENQEKAFQKRPSLHMKRKVTTMQTEGSGETTLWRLKTEERLIHCMQGFIMWM